MSITWGPSLFPHFSPISRLLFWTPWRMLTSLLKGYATVWWWDTEWKNCCKCGDAFWQCPCRSFFKELPVLWESFFFFLTSLLKLHFLIAIFLKSSMLFASSKESSHNYPFFFILFLLNPWSGVQTTPPLFVQGQTRSKNFLGRSLLMYCRRRDTQCPGQMSRLSISLVRGPHPGVIHSILWYQSWINNSYQVLMSFKEHGSIWVFD